MQAYLDGTLRKLPGQAAISGVGFPSPGAGSSCLAQAAPPRQQPKKPESALLVQR